jgi:hypothetical protein
MERFMGKPGREEARKKPFLRSSVPAFLLKPFVPGHY